MDAPDDPQRLLIVDDVYAGGFTAAVLVQAIAGWARAPLDIVVACPLWVTGHLDPQSE